MSGGAEPRGVRWSHDGSGPRRPGALPAASRCPERLGGGVLLPVPRVGAPREGAERDLRLPEARR